MRAIPILCCCLVVAGCDDVKTYDEPGGIVIYDAGPGGPPDGGIRPNRPVMTGEITPVYGFVSPEAKVEYYYLGEVDQQGNAVPVNPIYLFYDENDRPLFKLADDGSRVVGWHPVVDVIPTKGGYSPFWRVHQVRVKGTVDDKALTDLTDLPTTKETCQMDAVCPGDQKCIEDRCHDPINIGVFELDGIKSLETLEASKLVITPTKTIINCPVVDADAKLLKGLADPDKPFPKVQLWYKRLKAFCYLMEGGKAILGSGASDLPPDKAPPVSDAYFIRRELTFGTKTNQDILPARHLLLTEQLPGTAGYSPLVKEHTVFVDTDHTFKDLRSLAEAKAAGLKITSTNNLHNLVVRGTIPACTTDDDCAKTGGKVDPPLKCSIEQGYCAPPFSKVFEECRAGVKECDPKGGPNDTPLICLRLTVRKQYYCFNACDPKEPDTNPDPDVDSRCGSTKNFRCYIVGGSPDPNRPSGVCIWKCNSLAGDKQNLINQCVSTGCGNGKLDYGETCDDGNNKNGDGCNEFCTLSTYARCDVDSDCKGTEDNPVQTCNEPAAGQGKNYCLPSDKEKDERKDQDKYRTICMEYDYCWPPEERAEWLGKKEEDQ